MDESFLPAWGNIGTVLINERRYYEALPVAHKVLDLDPDNPIAHMNLGWIYRNLGKLDQALASTLKSLELKSDNPGALNNLKAFIENLNLSQSNAKDLTRAYELLLDRTDISHRKLTKIFIQAYLNPSIGIRSDYYR